MKKLLVLVAAIVMASCAKENQTPSFSGEVAIDPTITRATEVDFESGDAIGLNIATADAGYVQNEKMVFNGENFLSPTTLLWYDDLGVESTLTAYYPYSESEPTSFTVAENQSGDGYYASDLMMAKKEGVTPSVQAIDMTFYHKMTKIVINLTNEYGLEIEDVKLSGSLASALVDVAAQSVEVDTDSDLVTISALKLSDSKWAAIVVPQSVALKVEVMVDGKAMSCSLAEAKLQGGSQYNVAVTILPDEIDVVLSGDIADWDDAGALQPEQDGGDSSSEVSFEEFDTYFVYDGVSYNFKTFADGKTWMTENLRYVPAGLTVSSDPTVDTGVWYSYTSDGTTQTPVTDEEGVERLGLLYNARSVFGTEITLTNASSFEGAQGICPKGWHVPTLDEIVGLVGKCSKLSNAAVGDYAMGDTPTNSEAPFYNSDYDGGYIPALNEAGFNFVYSGMRNGSGAYQKGITAGPDKPMTYLWGSTLYQTTLNTDGSMKNAQFISLGSSVAASYPDGRLTGMFETYTFGSALRCVRDTAK